MIETSLKIEFDNITLAGTLSRPSESGNFPLALFIQGSGNTDRNDNFPSSKNKSPKSSATFFNELGFASFRYDKRGIAESSGDFYSAGHDDLVSDADCILEFLIESEYCEIDKTILVGHSEGALIASRLAAKHRNTAGIILLCPPYKKLEDTLLYQAENMETMARNQKGLGGILLRVFFRFYNPIKGQHKFNKRIRESSEDTIRYMLMKTPAKWFREILKIDPHILYADVRCPTLAIGGTKDTQCDPNDIELIKHAIPGPAEGHVIPDLTHVLRREPNEVTFMTNMKLLKQPIDSGLREIVRNWIKDISQGWPTHNKQINQGQG